MATALWRHALRAMAPAVARQRTAPRALHGTKPPAIQLPVWPALVRHWSTERGESPPPVAKEKVAVELREEDLEESFVKGWGKGGQKINKVRNCVLLKHVPSGLHVRCQETRSLDGNRRIARRLLLQKLDDQVNGALSKRNLKISKLRKKKANRSHKAKRKYAAGANGDADADTDAESDEESASDEEEEGEEDEFDEEDDVDVVEFDVDEHAFRPKKKK